MSMNSAATTECQEFNHWRLACPNCGGEIHEVGRSCFGYDPHVSYACWECGWRGRSGLAVGSPSYVHDQGAHDDPEQNGRSGGDSP